MSHKILAIIDFQNCLMTNTPNGFTITGIAEMVPEFNRLHDTMFERTLFAMDWHPKNHISFACSHPGRKEFDIIKAPGGIGQMIFPVHTVAGTEAAQLYSGLHVDYTKDIIIHKATDKDFDSYSCFWNNARTAQTSADLELKAFEITDIYFSGFATDFCLKHSVLDAVKLGYRVFLFENLTNGFTPEATAKAKEEMRAAGVTFLQSTDYK
jgi:nicotinamidase/pyrazinamidase